MSLFNPFKKYDPYEKEYNKYMSEKYGSSDFNPNKEDNISVGWILAFAILGLGSFYGSIIIFALNQNFLIFPIWVAALYLLSKYDEIKNMWRWEKDLRKSVNGFALTFIAEIIMVIIYLIMIL